MVRRPYLLLLLFLFYFLNNSSRLMVFSFYMPMVFLEKYFKFIILRK